MSGPGKLWVGIEEGAPSSSHPPEMLLNSDSNINMWRENQQVSEIFSQMDTKPSGVHIPRLPPAATQFCGAGSFLTGSGLEYFFHRLRLQLL